MPELLDINDDEIAVIENGKTLAILPVPGVLRLSLENTMQRVARWLRSMHNSQLRTNKRERALRLVEEAMELAQATGEVSYKDVIATAHHVMLREPGDEGKEMAGVMVTALAYAVCNDINIGEVFEAEMQRIEAPEFGAKIAAAQERKRAAGLDADGDVREMLTFNERIDKLAHLMAAGMDVDYTALPDHVDGMGLDRELLHASALNAYLGLKRDLPQHNPKRMTDVKGW